jgi:hypothetical protein
VLVGSGEQARKRSTRRECGERESATGGVMEVKSGVSAGVAAQDDQGAGTGALVPIPSEHVINLLGSGEWALVVEALAMGETRAVKTRRRAHRLIAGSERGERSP